MRKIRLILTAFLLSLSLATPAMVHAELTGPTTQAIGHVIMTEQVVMADQIIKTLVMQTSACDPIREKELVFAVAKKDDKVLRELRPGDQVTVEYTDRDGKLTAHSIKKS